MVRQASGGSNNVCRREVSAQNGVPVATHSWQASNSADGPLRLPPPASRQDTSGLGERSGRGHSRWPEKPVERLGTGRCPLLPPGYAPSHLQTVPSECSSPFLPQPPSAPSPDILEHKAASVRSTGAHNPRWGHIPGTSPDRPEGLASLPLPEGLALRTPAWGINQANWHIPQLSQVGLAGVGGGEKDKADPGFQAAPSPPTQCGAPHPDTPAPQESGPALRARLFHPCPAAPSSA